MIVFCDLRTQSLSSEIMNYCVRSIRNIREQGFRIQGFRVSPRIRTVRGRSYLVTQTLDRLLTVRILRVGNESERGLTR